MLGLGLPSVVREVGSNSGIRSLAKGIAGITIYEIVLRLAWCGDVPRRASFDPLRCRVTPAREEKNHGFVRGRRNRVNRKARRGLTLLELVVVLAILVAIGGLVVPLLGNYLHRANIASCAVNIPEMDKWIQTYTNLYAAYPDRMDNLCLAAGGLASYVQTGCRRRLRRVVHRG